MKKVHIVTVGGQPVPIYLGLKEDKDFDLIVAICSKMSEDEAQRILDFFPDTQKHFIKCSTDNLQEIEQVAAEISKICEGWQVTLNLTGGPKLWTISFYGALSHQANTRVIYLDQNNKLTDLQTKETQILNIDKETRFKLHGSPINSYTNLEDYTEEDLMVAEAIRDLRQINPKVFHELTGSVGQDCKTNGYKKQAEKQNGLVKYHPTSNQIEIELHGYGANAKKKVEKTFSAPHVFEIVFNSGWCELIIADKISTSPLVEDVWMNCKFTASNGRDKNEIDIIVDLGAKLLFVECKTMIYDTTDVDKFRSATRNFSGTSTGLLFVTHDAPKPNSRSESLYAACMEKCKDNRIKTCNMSIEPYLLLDIIESFGKEQNLR